jgi:cytochrome c peroxidase
MAAYALNSPSFFFDGELWVGGQFWDGRADDLAEQAKGPFLNPVEMGMPDRAAVVEALFADDNKNKNAYEALFPAAFPGITDSIDDIYNAMADAIAAFEMTPSFNEFSSKFDYVLNQDYVALDGVVLDQVGLVGVFSTAEIRGMQVFFDDTAGGGQCVLCHMPPDFTDFTYDNLGIPKSKNDIIKKNPVDLGLANTITNLGSIPDNPLAAAALQEGKFKVMTVRNVELTAPYGHNGYFATMEEIVHFYNTRDVDRMWKKPEVPQNVNSNELGDLGLSPDQEADLVAFLKTLTDGYHP